MSWISRRWSSLQSKNCFTDGANPLLSTARVADNGGTDTTIRLLDASAVIDAIRLADYTGQALPPNPITSDQRLFPRSNTG